MACLPACSALRHLHARQHGFRSPRCPDDRLDDYLHFTEASLSVDVQRWATSNDPRLRDLGQRWRQLFARQVPWVTVCSRNLLFAKDDSEQASIFSDPSLVEQKLRQLLPPDLRDLPLRVD